MGLLASDSDEPEIKLKGQNLWLPLVRNPQSYYDYLCIIRFVLPGIIFEKLRLPMPLSWHRDVRQICSAAVYGIFHSAKLVDILLPYCTPLLPEDFVTDSGLLEESWWSALSEELIPLEGHAKERAYSEKLFSSYIGISTITVVPLSGLDLILKLPSNRRIRSCIPISPSLPARDRSSKLSGR